MIDNRIKPLYLVPSMTEISAVSKNGLKVVSTFSGCGGSCLGYRMAGFEVIWANEFAPSAQVNYLANTTVNCHLDHRDVRKIQSREILDQCGLREGELDLLDGSPPCQAFSTAGSRHKGWGREKRYEHGVWQCNEDLFAEYIRLLRGLKPRTFVAENVSGLAKGVAKGMFLNILADLKANEYRVKCKLLNAQWLGVPQVRRRLIFIGVRNDLGVNPVFPSPLSYYYSVRDAIPWIVRGKYGADWNRADRPSPTVSASMNYNPATSHQSLELVEVERLPPSRLKNGAYAVTDVRPELSCPTVTVVSPGNDLSVPAVNNERRKLTIAELKRICGFPDDFKLTGTYAEQWKCLGNSVPPVMMRYIAECVRDKILLPWQVNAGSKTVPV